jgi:hypothetical protein
MISVSTSQGEARQEAFLQRVKVSRDGRAAPKIKCAGDNDGVLHRRHDPSLNYDLRFEVLA